MFRALPEFPVVRRSGCGLTCCLSPRLPGGLPRTERPGANARLTSEQPGDAPGGPSCRPRGGGRPGWTGGSSHRWVSVQWPHFTEEAREGQGERGLPQIPAAQVTQALWEPARAAGRPGMWFQATAPDLSHSKGRRSPGPVSVHPPAITAVSPPLSCWRENSPSRKGRPPPASCR